MAVLLSTTMVPFYYLTIESLSSISITKFDMAPN